MAENEVSTGTATESAPAEGASNTVDVGGVSVTGKKLVFAKSFREQFTLRGIIIGLIGCLIVTTSSIYVALKMGALPWPIIFVALVSMFGLKVCEKVGRRFGKKGGRTANINEINVTHTVMSAGAMVAGGVAFTIPGVWILDANADVETWQLFIAVFSGVILGLMGIALFRKHFIEDEKLPYPIGTAAAETLVTATEGGKQSGILFGSMAFAAIWTALRDWFAKIPALLTCGVSIPGVTFGIYMSPMMIAVGYLLGPTLLLVWFLGGCIGDFGIVVGGTAAGWWDLETAQGIKSSLGIGVMIGTGVGIIVKKILPKSKSIFGSMFKRDAHSDSTVSLRWAPWAMVIIALVLTFALDLGIVASIIVIIGAWITGAMSAQITGQTGINPMEIFGVIVLLCVKVCSDCGTLPLFLVAAVIAVGCGLIGDVMNDFKVGSVVHTNPKAQWFGESLGGLLGAAVAVAVFMILLHAYGAGAFGAGQEFVAAQASVVAALVGGVPNMHAFIIGLIVGFVLFCLGLPVMTLGLGIYLPFYLSLTAALGGLIKLILDRVKPDLDKKGNGLIVASGLLGGEAVTGVIIALILVGMGVTAL